MHQKKEYASLNQCSLFFFQTVFDTKIMTNAAFRMVNTMEERSGFGDTVKDDPDNINKKCI